MTLDVNVGMSTISYETFGTVQTMTEETSECYSLGNERKMRERRECFKSIHPQPERMAQSNTTRSVASSTSKEPADHITSNTIKLLEAVQTLKAAKRKRRTASYLQPIGVDVSTVISTEDGDNCSNDESHLLTTDTRVVSVDGGSAVGTQETMESIVMNRILTSNNQSKMQSNGKVDATTLNEITNDTKQDDIKFSNEYVVDPLKESPVTPGRDDKVKIESHHQVALAELKQRLHRRTQQKEAIQNDVLLTPSTAMIPDHQKMSDKLLELQKKFISSFDVCQQSSTLEQKKEVLMEFENCQISDNGGLEFCLMPSHLNLCHYPQHKKEEEQSQATTATESISSISYPESPSKVSHATMQKLLTPNSSKTTKKPFVSPVSSVSWINSPVVEVQAHEISFMPALNEVDDECCDEGSTGIDKGQDLIFSFYPSFWVTEDNTLKNVVEEMVKKSEEITDQIRSRSSVCDVNMTNNDIFFLPTIALTQIDEDSSVVLDSKIDVEDNIRGRSGVSAAFMKEFERRKRILSS